MNNKETKGAWIIHHGRKLALDANGSAEFPALDEAAKAATLLTKLGQAGEDCIPKTEVKAIAVASGLNPRLELTALLQLLETRRLISQSESEVVVLGVTTRGALSQASDIFSDAEPNDYEQASLTLAELTSAQPVRRLAAAEEIGDEHRLSKSQVNDFLGRAEEIGFIDREGEGDDKLLFNGNLFRKDSISKTERVLSSLGSSEQRLLQEVNDELARVGCLSYKTVENKLSAPVFDKLIAAGMFDLNHVTNEQGGHIYVTSPSAFHKFVDPMIDDCFDMAKSLVAALSYGMTARSSGSGRIAQLPALLGKLISGYEIGPATAIGEDYRVLEINRVVKIRPHPSLSRRFFMRLLKKEIGELALQVLTKGNAYSQPFTVLGSRPMSGYLGPEDKRMAVRKKQSAMSKRTTRDVLEAVRGGDF
ncbi:hypothetical protein [Pseudomonas putida]|uniref:hypothetical protein n=1 Tax=Pseudomonas putida TaxID=303 RepID=UPI0023644D59|nr:hypothetical protein [Pseudomonas putida]MDD2144696.1 hypothetical protein [Pseudomonas putida]HDS1709068.1 hypothetical protein [Pseudomonas putida]